MFSDLDPILHSQLRLAIVSLLIAEEKADFARIKQATKATSGNISVQIQKLETAGYISVTKSFKDNYPNTEITLTHKGLLAFESYVEALKSYLVIDTNHSWKAICPFANEFLFAKELIGKWIFWEITPPLI